MMKVHTINLLHCWLYTTGNNCHKISFWQECSEWNDYHFNKKLQKLALKSLILFVVKEYIFRLLA